MRKFLAAFVIMFAAAIVSAPASTNVVISINKITQRMTVNVDGVQKYNWPVSTGKFGYGTPSGSYTPFRLEVDHYSREWDDAPMPHSIFFTTRGHAIHGTAYTARLGSRASHGCVRLSEANAATLFSLVKSRGLKNTRIVISGGFDVGADAPSFPAVGKLKVPKVELSPGLKKLFGRN